jgi:hypothetical protein
MNFDSFLCHCMGERKDFCRKNILKKKKLPIIRQLEVGLFFEVYIVRFVLEYQAVWPLD